MFLKSVLKRVKRAITLGAHAPQNVVLWRMASHLAIHTALIGVEPDETKAVTSLWAYNQRNAAVRVGAHIL